jgi:hypothetical protein
VLFRCASSERTWRRWRRRQEITGEASATMSCDGGGRQRERGSNGDGEHVQEVRWLTPKLNVQTPLPEKVDGRRNQRKTSPETEKGTTIFA